MPKIHSTFEDYMNGVYDRIRQQETTYRFNDFHDSKYHRAEKQKQYKAQPQQRQPLTKAEKIVAIERELDILRGRIPTPKGYNIDKSKARTLMKELKQLQTIA